ncbi:hypothetical protein KP509_34G056200 [Ceratopteris richardii]|uniref:Dof-type domain-containing protein n=1 Tax=Ceratopteris richardii TaxID=49495 RepID=A0A8T2QLK1_CERRI|nr:hypothetical protein KP509_34G056200 [Ceratopteris richardii]
MQAVSEASQDNTQVSVVATSSMKETPTNPKSSGSPSQSPQKCPRCESIETKFCYYNNHNKKQPRHFCKSCQRHWTRGGALRNIPIGGGCRRNRRIRPKSAWFSNVRDSHTATLFNLEALTKINDSMCGTPWIPSPLQIPPLQTHTVAQLQTNILPLQSHNLPSLQPQSIPQFQAASPHAPIWISNCRKSDLPSSEMQIHNPSTCNFVQLSSSSMNLRTIPSIDIHTTVHEHSDQSLVRLQLPINQLVSPIASFPKDQFSDESDMKYRPPMAMGMYNNNDSLSIFQGLSIKKEMLPNGMLREQPLPPPLTQSIYMKTDPLMVHALTLPCQYPSKSKDFPECKKVQNTLEECIPASSYTNSSPISDHSSSPSTILETYSQLTKENDFDVAALDIQEGNEEAFFIEHVLKDKPSQDPFNPKVDEKNSQDHGLDAHIDLKEFNELVGKCLSIFEEV